MIKISLLMGRVLNPKNKFLGTLTRLFFYLISYYKPAKDYIFQMRFKPKPSLVRVFYGKQIISMKMN